MKVLALYTTKTLSLMRRVQAPFSTLYERGHPFSFLQVPSFNPGLGASHDVTVLQNWELTRDEIVLLQKAISEQGQTFVYDCSDPTLLTKPLVQEVMNLCQLVTVPNTYMEKEVKIVVGKQRVVVLPSMLDIPYFMTAHTYPRPEKRIVGCFGPFDWWMVKDTLLAMRERYPSVSFLGDDRAQEILGDLVEMVEVNPDTYPLLLRSCTMGLLPREHADGRDMIWQQEYALFGKMTWCPIGPQSGLPALLISCLSTSTPDMRKLLVESAMKHRATQLCGQYLNVYQKQLPQLGYHRYTQSG